MKVHELIAELAQLPQDAYVVIRGYEDGVNDARRVAPRRIKRDANTQWYYGQHETLSEYDDGGEIAYEIYGENELA